MKKIQSILLILLVVSISLIALVLAIEENAYDLDYYMNSFEENGVYVTTGKSQGELEVVSKDIISYLKGREDDNFLYKHFNEKEVLHMIDVLDLFDIARVIKLISSIISLVIVFYFLSKSLAGLMGKWIGIGLFTNHLLIIILGVLILIDFTKYFTIFHEIFFSNDLWLLDPRTDFLIQMLPEPFFVNMAKNIGISFIKYLSIAQIIGYVFYKKGKYKIPHFENQKKL